jgi:hypothetical protein
MNTAMIEVNVEQSLNEKLKFYQEYYVCSSRCINNGGNS